MGLVCEATCKQGVQDVRKPSDMHPYMCLGLCFPEELRLSDELTQACDEQFREG